MTEPLDQGGRAASKTAPGASARELLAAVPFLSALSREELDGLADAAVVSRFDPGAVVVREGEEGESLFLVSSGLLMVQTSGPGGNQVTVGALAVGDFFGEISLLLGRPRTATVRADTDTTCLEIRREAWSRLQRTHPALREILEEALQSRAANSAEAVVQDYRRRRSAGETGS